MQFVTPAQMREMDRQAIEDFGIPGIVLMERAALGACDVFELHFGEDAQRVAVLCGAGNNGGDGLAMARMLDERGYNVAIFLLAPPSKLRGDAKTNFDIAKKLDLTVYDVSEANPGSMEQELLRHGAFDVWIDAVFGTGLDREVKGIYRAAIEFVNGQEVFAVDIPSGIDGRTGQVQGVAVQAQVTATFANPKTGNVVYPGRAHCGALHTVAIGIPEAVRNTVGTAGQLLTEVDALGSRPPVFHKGDAGRVLAVGGRAGKTGAILMTAKAAMLSGAGLLVVGTDAASAPHIAPAVNELMAEDVFSTDALAKHVEWADVVAFGPGLGLDEHAQHALRTVAGLADALVLDADGLNALADDIGLPTRTILTPHPGEAARLANTTVETIVSDPIQSARSLAAKYQAVVILKGPGSVIAAPDGRIAINTTGNPGMATGGMGDALTGICAAFLHELVEPFHAACSATYVHGLAGDLAVEETGERSLMVSDLLAALPEAIQELEW